MRARPRVAGVPRDAGVTLVEVMVATTIFATVSGALLAGLLSTQRSELELAQDDARRADARTALAQLSADLRGATAIVATGGEPSDTRLVLQRRTTDGTLVEVLWEAAGTPPALLRAEPAGGTPVPVVTDLVAPARPFTYLDRTGAVLATGSSRRCAATAVRVELLLRDPDGRAPVPLVADVALRNRTHPPVATCP